MRILLDECVPSPMQKLLPGHTCSTVPERGWSGVKNGELLDRAIGEFDLFITADQNIRYQQNLTGRSIAILELSTSDIRRIQAAVSLIQDAINQAQPSEFIRVSIP